MQYTETADGSTIVSDSAPIRIVGASMLDGCRLDGNGDAVCAPNARPSGIELGDGNDTIRYTASESMGLPRFGGGLDAGAGNDTIFAGIRRNPVGVLFIEGGSGTADKVTYASAPSGATVSLDGDSNDGVLTGDKQNVFSGVEVLEGSSFGDRLDGSDAEHREQFTGGLGFDIINGGGGPDVFHEGPVPTGSDDLNGGGGIDLVDYSLRTQGVVIGHDSRSTTEQSARRTSSTPTSRTSSAARRPTTSRPAPART